MRKSPLRHTIAVFRNFLGVQQKRMGEIAGCSVPTIQAIELGKLKLTEVMAERIVQRTNLDFDWLLNGNTNAPMINTFGKPYCLWDYESAQGKLSFLADKPDWTKDSDVFAKQFTKLYENRIHAILFKAFNVSRYQWACWKIEQTLKSLEDELKINANRPTDLNDDKKSATTKGKK